MLSEPHFVIFDEVHFGKFASYYLRREYFFDVHPPIGKMLLALVGYLSGNDGSYLFENLGADYLVDNVPYLPLRAFCAVLGALIAPASFVTLSAFGYSVVTSTLAGLLVVLDVGLLTQSRYILLDSMLLFFTIAAFASLAQFISKRESPFTSGWIFWLASTGVFLGFAVGIKYVGIFVIAAVGLYTIYDLWTLLGDLSVPILGAGSDDRPTFIEHFAIRAVFLIIVPIAIFLAGFAIHFAVLTQSGPGDAFMSLAFQAGLQGSSIQNLTRTHPKTIYYGAYVTIKSQAHNCYIHSHLHRYPLHYPTGRVSSAQQQVTCYAHKDANNWWIILREQDTDASQYKELMPVRHGDRIKLVHATSNTTLNSHDVAGPVNAILQEVSTFNAAVDTVTPYPVFRIDTNYSPILWSTLGLGGTPEWESMLPFRLHHENTSATLQTKGEALPEWGFGQGEVTTAVTGVSIADSSFVVEEIEDHIFRHSDATNPIRARLGFLQSFIELQTEMFAANNRLTDNHAYQSRPSEWPLLHRGISFWQGDQRQVYLIGNPVIWWSATAAILLLAVADVVLLIRERRAVYDLAPATRFRMVVCGRMLLLAWALHYVPFMTFARQLFLHHYLPALMFKIMILAIVLEHGVEFVVGLAAKLFGPSVRSSGRVALLMVASTTTAVAIRYFLLLAPLAYGMYQARSDVEAIKLRKSWDLKL
ncbi:dolichyl-phosphate-mannose-protein mannosyltransferase, variant [Capsaspora owczarzaki ATCC 30864]|nr:dolichyl-phosphate-mannose-protein mannosyltransferase, variant [Capsaspora owczarzaki ATCC 30864]|eukprot:XP_011270320.1 dolichyl-phosphate-mannose-protein mannosyltransferase, variant [Capsaspora owczarzaki ATCC 30864]